MKHLLMIGVGLAGAIAVSTPASAEPTRTDISTAPNQRQLYTSDALAIPSVSLEQTDTNRNSANRSPYDKAKLNDVANSIQLSPAQSKIKGVPSSVIPRDLIRTPSRPSNLNPIEFFQVPPLDPSVGINVSRD